VERFKPGRDGGVDGRFFTSDNMEVVIQSKHYLKSGYKSLLNHCLKTESPKVRKLNPSRYIFACSEPLSRIQKSELANTFTPYLKENDVYGKDDLNDLLKIHPEVEKNHYKLWLTSTTILQHLLHHGIYARSRYTLEDVRSKLKFYAKTSTHDLAISRLSNEHCIIITGAPGIGKTTLAEQLSNDLVSNGYQFIEVQNDINEVWDVFQDDTKQVFYYDDFLGSNYLEAFSNREDSSIVKFINAVRSASCGNKKFILTSRASIFNQSLKISNSFNISHIKSRNLVINIENLSYYEKAEILYNHIFFSGLNESYIDEFYKDNFYLNIVKHKNFNPRLISFITSPERISHIESKSYLKHIITSLNNPQDIWGHAFTEQLKELDQVLIYYIAFCNISPSLSDLKKFILNYCECKHIHFNTEKFNKSVNVISGSFVIRELKNDGHKYIIINPSLRDYLISKLKCDTDFSIDIFFIINEPNSISNFRLFTFDRKYQYIIIDGLVKLITPNELSTHFKLLEKCIAILLNYDRRVNFSSVEMIYEKIINMGNTNKPLDDNETVIIHAYLKQKNVVNFKILNDFLINRDWHLISEDCLKTLSNIIFLFPENYLEKLTKIFEINSLLFWENNSTDYAKSISMIDFYDCDYSYRQVIEDTVIDSISDRIESYSIDILAVIEPAIDSLEMDDIIDHHSPEYYESEKEKKNTDTSDEGLIINLFDRG
ncbi:MAG: ATP-binding protein, partial [Flavobacteriaceae bacterium]|nr:ATP-binding protein [Flavobacteriaceae bacterium]